MTDTPVVLLAVLSLSLCFALLMILRISMSLDKIEKRLDTLEKNEDDDCPCLTPKPSSK